MKTQIKYIFYILSFTVINQGLALENSGTWFWANTTNLAIIGDSVKEKEVTVFLKNHGFTKLYISASVFNQKSDTQMSNWICQLSKQNIKAYFLINNYNLVLPEHKEEWQLPVELHLIKYNNEIKKKCGKFAGIHLDVEPHTLQEWKTQSIPRYELLTNLLDLFVAVRSQLEPSLEVSADLPPSFTDTSLWPNMQEERKQWFETLSKVLDEVVIMNYRSSNFNVLVSRMKPWVTLLGLNTQLRLALRLPIDWKTPEEMLSMADRLSDYYLGSMPVDFHPFTEYWTKVP